MGHLRSVLKKGFDGTSNALLDDRDFIELLGGMLEINPNRRMSPDEILSHVFLN
jgi:serine/threonine protein kinase